MTPVSIISPSAPFGDMCTTISWFLHQRQVTIVWGFERLVFEEQLLPGGGVHNVRLDCELANILLDIEAIIKCSLGKLQRHLDLVE